MIRKDPRAILAVLGKHSFQDLDTNKDGFIDRYELEDRLKSLSISFQASDIDNIMAELDSNDDDQISHEEFKKAQTTWATTVHPAVQILAGGTDAWSAVVNGSPNKLRGFLKDDPALVNSQHPKLRVTLLYTAARVGAVDMVRVIIDEAKGNVNIRNMDSECTPLHGAAFGGHSQIVEFLLLRGAKVVQNMYGDLPNDDCDTSTAGDKCRDLLEKANLTYYGFLEKKSSAFHGQLQRRYFELKKSQLSYYKIDKTGRKEGKGVIDISGATVQAETPPKHAFTLVLKSQHQHVDIKNEDRKILLVASSNDQRKKWMDHLTTAANYKDEGASLFEFQTQVARTAVAPDTEVHKVGIIGGGAAGNTAAIYTARARLNPVVFEGFNAAGIAAGGQLTTTTQVDNFPGWPDGILGTELMERTRQQAINCGANIITETVTGCDLSQRPFTLNLQNGGKVRAESLIIAAGASWKRLKIPGEDTYWQNGISCSAVCNGAAPLFKKKTIGVVGGNDVACEEATFMTRFANKVIMLNMKSEMDASFVMQERVKNEPKIEVLYNLMVIEAKGDGNKLSSIKVRNTQTNKVEELFISGLFYAIGQTPNTEFLEGQVQLDEQKYIVTRGTGNTMTSVEGVFTCGDVRDSHYRQAVVAAGAGACAAMDCERWLDGQLGKRRAAGITGATTVKKVQQEKANADKENEKEQQEGKCDAE